MAFRIPKAFPLIQRNRKNKVENANPRSRLVVHRGLGKSSVAHHSNEDGRELYAVAVDKNSGKILHDIKLFDVAAPQFAHKFNSYGSPTPVIEAGRVYVTFGSPGTACLETATGKVLWERRDFVCNHFARGFLSHSS